MIEYLVEKLMKWCERTGRIFKITGTAGPDDVYLVRYYVFKSNWFNIFIHQFLRSDRDDLHDHPWNFATYLVRGSYCERKWNEDFKISEVIRRVDKLSMASFGGSGNHKTNRFVFRKATDQHQVLVDKDLKENEKDQAALTICVTGRTQREWGFIKEITVQDDGITPISEKYRPIRKWIPWRKYLRLPDNTPGRG